MEFKYAKEVRNILDEVDRKENGAMEKSVHILTEAILAQKSVFVFGASHAGILAQELYYRAGGLMTINPIFGREIMLDTQPITHTSRMEQLVGYGTLLAENADMRAGDVLIVHSVSGRNPVSVELAMEAKRLRVTVICLTNLAYSKSVESRHPSGKRLFEVSDVVIDNHGQRGDACVAIEGVEQKVGPTSTVVGAYILNSIVAATAEELVRRGLKHPPIFYSANLDGGRERNMELFQTYRDSIHYRF